MRNLPGKKMFTIIRISPVNLLTLGISQKPMTDKNRKIMRTLPRNPVKQLLVRAHNYRIEGICAIIRRNEEE